MRHLAIRTRRLSDVGAATPYKTRCGLARADHGTAGQGEPWCPRCFTAGTKGDPTPWGFTTSQALDIAVMAADRGGRLKQDAFQRLLARLPNSMDKHEFILALTANQIRVAGVNVVDKEESGQGGDAGGGVADDIFSMPQFPLAETNNDPGGTTELEYNKPRRTEGSPSGWNLDDLTTAALHSPGAYAVSPDEMAAILNEGIGLEFSQGLRYRVYAEQMLSPVRDSLAEEFLDHAATEDGHAQILLRHLVASGGKPSFEVDQVKAIDPEAPDAIEAVLTELYAREQTGLDYYLKLREACGTSTFRHAVEEIIAAEIEHNDDLARLSAVMVRVGAVVPGPGEPFPSTEKMWGESYSDENQFEGLDKLGGIYCTCAEGPDEDGIPHQCNRCGKTVPGCIPVTAGATKRRLNAWRRKAEAVKRMTRFGEIPVAIEWNKGETRKGVGKNGPWERVMTADYGYIPGTVSADGEPFDVYLGDTPQSRKCFVVSQLDGDTGAFDEEKALLGYRDAEIAEAAYRSHYPDNGNKHFGGIREMSMDDFIAKHVHQPGRDGYAPTLEVRVVPKEREADHGPGDADGCGGEGGDGGTPAPPPAKPGKAPPSPGKPQPKSLADVDTSLVKSPTEEAWKSDQGKGKQVYDQLLKLLGGPGFNPYQGNLDDLTTDAVGKAVTSMGLPGDLPAGDDLFDTPLHGPLGNPDPPPGTVQREHV